MGVSTLVALAGIGLATMFFLQRARARPTRWPRASAALHRLLLGKYFVDEIYDAAIVQPIKRTLDDAALARRRRRA